MDSGSLWHLGADIPQNYNGLFESEEDAEVVWSVELLSPSKLTMKEMECLAEHDRSRALYRVTRQRRERAAVAMETAAIAARPSRGANRDRFGEDTEERIDEEEAAAASSLLGIRSTVRTEREGLRSGVAGACGPTASGQRDREKGRAERARERELCGRRIGLGGRYPEL